MILFFDTETTGLPDRYTPLNFDRQPHCVQLAALLTEDDGTERASLNLIVHPDGWTIPEAAAKVHGITTAMAQRCGVREAIAAAAFYDLTKKADLLVAHNIKFDVQIIDIMFARVPRGWRLLGEKFCTMDAAAQLVNLPPTERMIAAGIDKPKAPKLEECIKRFFNEELKGAHDAMVDVRACARLFFHLRDVEGPEA